MALLRGLAALGILLVALVLQVAVFGYFSVEGVVPDLVLLVVVAAALSRGPQFAAVLGFTGGLLLDLAPPADHVAGRWALALVVVGYLAGRVRQDARDSTFAALVTVAACSFVGTSIFALTGLVLHDGALPATGMLRVVGISVLWDVLVAPLALPGLLLLFRRLRPPQLVY
ncbi:MAG TPA: rod shape-determining protein MreD [Marmoricola sp.]|nr:rod shape-determining protein MreD [Marmoricola sp.]